MEVDQAGAPLAARLSAAEGQLRAVAGRKRLDPIGFWRENESKLVPPGVLVKHVVGAK
jgi:hypothetical protein